MRDICDMHCHAIPGVDDGAPSLEVSLLMLHRMYREGVRNVILTPHFRQGMFETPRDDVQRSFERLEKAAETVMPKMQLFLGCEFHDNPVMAQLLDLDGRYRINGTEYVLLEFSGGDSGRHIRERCRALIRAGYTPIVAHGERCRALHTDRKLVGDLKEMGACLQVNANSVLGLDGWRQKFFCQRAIEKGLVDFIGSDAHNMKDRQPHIGECAEFVLRKFGEKTARRIFVVNPARMAENLKL
ncbi:MAG: capsular biosynthesis protein [Lachnospiraceae bacterium]|nr:capsular biosynthesis protein [Lachnospiraceae bacterium]MCH4032041.1 capsular biosynthesis protein [Lachnospiraceae bacterium]MCH4070658.1 capsular biosynthesis protein [Lachnospiraceae bacterium]MCH4109332.1 capsular biosynthesis protein [Lachnospiraceae bacterium]MCI1556848.1 capsular biosynthesis protein [Lachnospiraceae bacterium]